MRVAAAGAILGLVLASSPVSAQNHETGRLFLDATAFAAVEQRSHGDYLSPVVTSNDFSRVVPGGGLAVGTFLTPRVSLRVDAAFPWGAETGTVAPPFASAITVVVNEQEYSNSSVAVLLGYHADAWGRVQFSYLGGVAFVRERSRYIQTLFSPGLPPIVPARTDRTELIAIDYRPAVAVGVDLEVPLLSRLSLMPQLRVVAFTGEISLRPGLALRWTP